MTVNPLVAFYDIHGRKLGMLFFCSIPDTRDWLVKTGIIIPYTYTNFHDMSDNVYTEYVSLLCTIY
jgi:hypothetical protein